MEGLASQAAGQAMTTIARIVEQFTMQLDSDPSGWFLDYVLRSPKQAGVHLTAGWLALQSLKDFEFKSCREYFGGMGAQALMVQELFGPWDHTVLEYSEEAIQHLSQVLPYPAMELHADSYSPASVLPADLVMLDFGDLTVWKTRKGEKHRGLLDRVFELEPKAVVFTDIACRYLHLHRERYESLLGAGTCGSYPAYLMSFLNRLESLYDYTLLHGYWDRWSTVMALVPSRLNRTSILAATPASPVGLELL
jgi:hypothetical protein